MFLLYQLIVSIILIFSPVIIIFRILKNKEDKKRFLEKFSFHTRKRKKGKLIWFHGASVGEILSVIPLIQYYEKTKSIKQILVTSSTLSSSKVIKKFKFKKTIHQFYPIDHFLFTNKFLQYWKPNLAMFIDSEIWPYMFKKINNQKIPLILLNARITKKTYKRWMKIKYFSNLVFNRITVAFPQNIETSFFLKKLSTKKIDLIGNLKFAENYDENLPDISKTLKYELKKKNVWIASSTHAKEEVFCIKAHLKIKKRIKNLITIIIPRHIHRTNEIISDIKKFNLKFVRHSSKPKILKDVDFYIVDTFGETKKFHKIASTVFLGGSITNRGGQNPLEAARCGAQILHGPNIDNFKDVYKLLNSLRVSKQVNSSDKLASSIKFKKYINVGNKIKIIGEKILKKTIKELNIIINNEIKKT
tara:strand:+ start:2051 stop:3301 length:1251 start_codon:yes stop_codon:yes gene_type:complete